MKRLKSFPAFFVALFVFAACSGTSGTSGASGDATPASGPPGNATWSASIDGQVVSGTGIDGLQQRNAAFQIVTGSTNEKALLFYLFDTKDGTDNAKFTHSMRFCIPNKEGPKHIDRSSPDHNLFGIAVNLVPEGSDIAGYYSNNIDVTITAITASHVTGTFSGKFDVSPDTPNAPKKEITVTDGKFDIPMAVSKLIPS